MLTFDRFDGFIVLKLVSDKYFVNNWFINNIDLYGMSCLGI